MIIKRIEMTNFRQFKEKQTIVFAEGESNITLLLGDNTSGKTTVLQAFLWCLYGRAEFESKDQLFNVELADEMSEGETGNVEVVIVLEHHEHIYEIKRQHQTRKVNNKVSLTGKSKLTLLKILTSGETELVKEKEKENEINNILPEELAPYFFYDTERFGNISEKKDLTKAVKGLLGLSVLENGIKHMGKISSKNSVLSRIQSGIDKEGDKKLQEKEQKLLDLEEEQLKSEAELERVNQEIVKYEGYVTKHKEKLKEIESTLRLQEERDAVEKEYERQEEKLEKERKHFVNTLNINPLRFYIEPIAEVLIKELSESEFEDAGIRDMNINSIHDLLNRKRCVCGTEIVEGSPHYDELQKMLRLLPPESIGVQVNHFIEQLQQNSSHFLSHFTAVKKQTDEISETKETLNALSDEYQLYSDKILDEDEAKGTQGQIIKSEEKIKELVRQNGALLAKIENNKEEFAEIEKKYNELIHSNKKSREQAMLLEYGKEIKAWLENDLNKKQTEARENLEEKVSYYFSQIYHGDRKVKIDDTYNVQLYSGDGVMTDESAGLETVKNFSFITGLVDLAKEKLEGEFEVDSEEYPLILDAPFSNVDERHVINISQVLPEAANQLMLIVMAKDWNYAEEKLDYRVGKKYELVKRSETNTVIKEV